MEARQNFGQYGGPHCPPAPFAADDLIVARSARSRLYSEQGLVSTGFHGVARVHGELLDQLDREKLKRDWIGQGWIWSVVTTTRPLGSP